MKEVENQCSYNGEQNQLVRYMKNYKLGGLNLSSDALF